MRRLGLGPGLIAGTAVAASGYFVFPLVDGTADQVLVVLGVMSAAIGGCQSLLFVGLGSIRQGFAPEAVRGRAMASMFFFMIGVVPAGAVLGGVLGEALGVRVVLLIVALGLLLVPDPWVRRSLATPSELARHVAGRVGRSKPSFITAEVTQAIFSASHSLPEYTFTAESLPCRIGFVWLQEPICLYEGPLFSRQVLLNAFQWYLNQEVQDERGRLPIMLDGYLVDPDRPKGVPTLHVTGELGLDTRRTLWRPGGRGQHQRHPGPGLCPVRGELFDFHGTTHHHPRQPTGESRDAAPYGAKSRHVSGS